MAENGLAVVAIGGNALIRDRSHESIPDQYDMVCALAEDIAAMIETGWRVLVTHGNGPQVGFILRRSEISISEVAPVPMDFFGASPRAQPPNALARAGSSCAIVTSPVTISVLPFGVNHVRCQRSRSSRVIASTVDSSPVPVNGLA